MFDSFYIVSYIIILVMLSDIYYTHLLFTWPCMFISHNHTIYLRFTCFSGLMEFYCGRFLLGERLLTRESITMR